MAKLDELQLKQNIKSNDISNAYLFYGEEGYLKQFYVNKLKQKLVDPAFESFNLHLFEGNDTTIDDILKDAQMLPMMSEYSLVIVRDFPTDRLQYDVKALVEYFKEINDLCVLVFWYDAVEPNEKSESFKKLIKAFDEAGAVVQMKKRSESDVAKLLVSAAQKRGATLDSSNARYLISVAGNDIKTLLNEIDKLSYFVGGGEITKAIIDDMAVKCLQAKIYDLSKHVVAGNTDSAYGVLDTLFAAKEDPLIILSTIIGVYVDMYRVKCAKSAGGNSNDLGKHLNYKGREFALRNASRDCAELTEKQLRSSLDVISQADIKMKSTAVDKKLLLEELIIKLVLIARERYNA